MQSEPDGLIHPEADARIGIELEAKLTYVEMLARRATRERFGLG
jgi:hypothetical protein